MTIESTKHTPTRPGGVRSPVGLLLATATIAALLTVGPSSPASATSITFGAYTGNVSVSFLDPFCHRSSNDLGVQAPLASSVQQSFWAGADVYWIAQVQEWRGGVWVPVRTLDDAYHGRVRGGFPAQPTWRGVDTGHVVPTYRTLVHNAWGDGYYVNQTEVRVSVTDGRYYRVAYWVHSPLEGWRTWTSGYCQA